MVPEEKIGVSLALAMKFPSIWFSNPLTFLGFDFQFGTDVSVRAAVIDDKDHLIQMHFVLKFG